jgi:hypothetical protein
MPKTSSMKLLQTLFFLSICFNSFSQMPKSGTYTYEFCDIKYNSCINTCKIKIKGNKVWVYAPSNLSGTKEGELFEKGVLYKCIKGNWIIKDTNIKYKKDNIFSYINFKTKQFWRF